MAKNTFCHIEFSCTDLKKSQAFYEGLFEWTFRSFGDEMVVFGTGEQHLGGLQKVSSVTPGNSPSVWVEVDDLDAYTAKAAKLGGKVLFRRAELMRLSKISGIATYHKYIKELAEGGYIVYKPSYDPNVMNEVILVG